MNIALIAQGRMPIPSANLGSIENIIWNYKQYVEKLGHTVTLYNTVWIHEAIYAINQKRFDFIHLHSDLFALHCNAYLKQQYCVTSHCGGFSKFIPGSDQYYPAFNYLYKDTLSAPGNLVLSEQIEDLYKKSNYDKFLRVLKNPVETKSFQQKEKGNGKAICVGKIQPRKQQAFLAKLLENEIQIDFVGPYSNEDEPDFRENSTARYMGIWSREQLYENLSDYSCLVLLSTSEGSALVTREALAAGVSVVVNEASSTDLTKEDFITILPDGEKEKAGISDAIHQAIENNNDLRESIRAYAYKTFDYEIIIPKYLTYIEEFKTYYNY